MLDEREQGVVRPVHVLKHKREGTRGRYELEKATPSRERRLGPLVQADACRRRCSDQRRESGGEPLLLGAIRYDSLDSRHELRRRLVRSVGREDPAVLLDDLAQRPEGDALAIREAAPVAPDQSLLRRGRAKLGDEPRLADARLPGDRHELR